MGFGDDNSSFCGIRDDKYPDVRAMGYPFDRPIVKDSPDHEDKDDLEYFVEDYQNMFRREITIRFENIVKTTRRDPQSKKENASNESERPTKIISEKPENKPKKANDWKPNPDL